MSIYEKVCAAREKLSTPGRDRDAKKEVLTQLMGLAFNNELHPDELPKLFNLYNINCRLPETLKEFLIESGVEVSEVTLMKVDYTRGATFEVTLV